MTVESETRALTSLLIMYAWMIFIEGRRLDSAVRWCSPGPSQFSKHKPRIEGILSRVEGRGKCTFTIPVFNNSAKRFWLNTVLNAEARLIDQWSLSSAWCGKSLLWDTSGCKFNGFIFVYVSKHATSLVTWIHTVCRASETFYINEPPIPTQLLEQALRLILQENSFQFNGKNYLQTHGTAMGTRMAAVTFSNILMNKIETEILS